MAALQGVHPALVINNKDPEQLARVLVRVSGVTDPNLEIWARLVTMMAGANRGTYFVPEIGDEVLVAFEREDERAAYVLGAMDLQKSPSASVTRHGIPAGTSAMAAPSSLARRAASVRIASVSPTA